MKESTSVQSANGGRCITSHRGSLPLPGSGGEVQLDGASITSAKAAPHHVGVTSLAFAAKLISPLPGNYNAEDDVTGVKPTHHVAWLVGVLLFWQAKYSSLYNAK